MMPVHINGMQLYRIGEALERANISRATYFRWVNGGRIPDARYRDRNGRRILTPEEVRTLVEAANVVTQVHPGEASQLPLQFKDDAP